MAGLLGPLTAVGAAISYAIYKRAQKASASVPDRYTKVSSVFPEEYDDVSRDWFYIYSHQYNLL